MADEKELGELEDKIEDLEDDLVDAKDIIDELAEVVELLLRAENRYKDGLSDERWSDAEMASNKRHARDQALRALGNAGYSTKGL